MTTPRSLKSRLDSIERLEQKTSLVKQALLQEAMLSTDPSALLKANGMMVATRNNDLSGDEVVRKAYLLDPDDYNNFQGYKAKPIAVTYEVLRRISYQVPVIRAIINTRIEQITAFCQPQSNPYSAGFIIRKKRKYYEPASAGRKVTKAEGAIIDELTEFVLNCGVVKNPYDKFQRDSFDTFSRKCLNDSLTYDQMNFEITHANNGKPYEFFAVDASTMRVADTIQTEKPGDNLLKDYKGDFYMRNVRSLNREKLHGQYPAYCQLYEGNVISDFYSWQMCWGIRNSTSSVYANEYGVSEIEMLINTITSLLWADEYNRKFFSQGSAPKGLLKIKPGVAGSGISNNRVNEFRQKWQNMMSGVGNAFRTPILEADIEWIDLQKTNRDMEFSHWLEFLIKISCAIFRIDPAEINFPLSGSSENKPLFEGNNEARLKHSKDKGLTPMARFYEAQINKYLIQPRNKDYEFVCVGLDNDDPSADLERDVKMIGNMATVDEIRKKRGLPPLGAKKGGDIILNPIWYQWYQGDQQKQLMMGPDGQPLDPNSSANEFSQQQEEKDNPFNKAFQSYWEKAIHSDTI